jgi:DNA-binding transcriptional ArsR family regulator
MTHRDLDHVWKALSDPTRREILDLLRDGPRQTTEIVGRFPDLSRFGVMKHLEVLREANLVHTRTDGRLRVNSLNVAPIREILERWISKYESYWANTLLRVRETAEEGIEVQEKRKKA